MEYRQRNVIEVRYDSSTASLPRPSFFSLKTFAAKSHHSKPFTLNHMSNIVVMYRVHCPLFGSKHTWYMYNSMLDSDPHLLPSKKNMKPCQVCPRGAGCTYAVCGGIIAPQLITSPNIIRCPHENDYTSIFRGYVERVGRQRSSASATLP